MAIKNFPTLADYSAAAKPTIESQVSMIEADKTVKYDGVNVITDAPEVGDAVFLNESNVPVILKGGDWIVKANIPAAWTYVGEVLEVVGNNRVRVIYKDIDKTRKWLDVAQFEWTTAQSSDPVTLDGEEHTKTIGIRCALDWANNTTVTCTYTATTLAEAAAAMQSAIEARLTELSATAAEIALWHCYADEAGSRVIIQRDAVNDYRFYNCSGITHITWGDMPANSNNGFRVNGLSSNQKIMNAAKGASYYGTNGRTPTGDVPLNEADTIVTLAAFTSSPYCALLRETYGTYQNYVESEYMVEVPQKLGVFGILDGKGMTDKYGPMTAPTKSGDTKFKFPALNWATTVGLNADGLRVGDWHLWDVREGAIMMRDAALALINKTRQKMGVTQISNATSRWFAERSNVYSAWFFYGTFGTLNYTNVYRTYQVGAVTLLKFK